MAESEGANMEQRYVVEIILKSGERLRLRCKEFKAHTNEGVLTGYKYSGSGNVIPKFAPLTFEIEIVDKEE